MRRAWRRLTAFAVAVAVPATTAVRAAIPTRPGPRRATMGRINISCLLAAAPAAVRWRGGGRVLARWPAAGESRLSDRVGHRLWNALAVNDRSVRRRHHVAQLVRPRVLEEDDRGRRTGVDVLGQRGQVGLGDKAVDRLGDDVQRLVRGLTLAFAQLE